MFHLQTSSWGGVQEADGICAVPVGGRTGENQSRRGEAAQPAQATAEGVPAAEGSPDPEPQDSQEVT